MSAKPTLEEVLKYAKPIIFQFIHKFAADSPDEHKEEIEQCAYVRIIEAYDRLDVEKGWKSFIYTHAGGAVQDYKKFGKGFHEQRWSIAKTEKPNGRHSSKIRDRVTPTQTVEDEEDELLDIDFILGGFGVFSEQTSTSKNIKWDLVARMASVDDVIHIFAKYLLGFKIEEISRFFGMSRSRTTQLIAAFVRRFDDPDIAEDTWFMQTIFAFGLCSKLGLKEVDQSKTMGFPYGWNLKPVDLYSKQATPIPVEFQLSLFDVNQ